jgi:hypothetical protein
LLSSIFLLLEGHFVTKVSLQFEISINSQFFSTKYNLFQEKYLPLKRGIFQIIRHKNQKKIEMQQKKPFPKQSYIYLANPKLHEA